TKRRYVVGLLLNIRVETTLGATVRVRNVVPKAWNGPGHLAGCCHVILSFMITVGRSALPKISCRHTRLPSISGWESAYRRAEIPHATFYFMRYAGLRQPRLRWLG